jgi:RNA polymerase sigma-70 factor (ECF subfamily)
VHSSKFRPERGLFRPRTTTFNQSDETAHALVGTLIVLRKSRPENNPTREAMMRAPSMVFAAHDATAAQLRSRQIGSRAALVKAIRAVAEGDKAAFAFVYNATADKLFGIVVRIVRRPDVAEEILQEVYLRIWQHAHTFDACLASPIAWMATIARYRALDEVRRKDAAIPLEECPNVLCLTDQNGALASRKSTRDLAVALERLSGDKRSILVQAYCYGLSREEIAKLAGRPVSTVKTWLRRALTELRAYLTEQESAALILPRCLGSPIHGQRAAALTKCTNRALSST